MPIVRLKDRATITVSGPDAEHLLQNIVTVDLDSLAMDTVKPSALLTPQGKIQFDFLISRAGPESLLLDCRADIAADLVRRLMLYRLRAKAEISLTDQADILVSWDNDSVSSEIDSGRVGALKDLRFVNVQVFRLYDSGLTPDADVVAWNSLRVDHAVAESGTDYTLGDAFPHDVLLDQNGGVGFRKGCYVGQEVVSRIHHRGTARRRVLIATATQLLPVSGTALHVGEREVGTLGTVVGEKALAIARIDRVKDAMDAGNPILAENVDLQLLIPSWATFTFPAATSESA